MHDVLIKSPFSNGGWRLILCLFVRRFVRQTNIFVEPTAQIDHLATLATKRHRASKRLEQKRSLTSRAKKSDCGFGHKADCTFALHNLTMGIRLQPMLALTGLLIFRISPKFHRSPLDPSIVVPLSCHTSGNGTLDPAVSNPTLQTTESMADR